jgi:hypothetical protein
MMTLGMLEWTQLALSIVAVLTHVLGVWDKTATYRELNASRDRGYEHLQIIAVAGIRSSVIRCIQQILVARFGVMALYMDPLLWHPKYETNMLVSLIVISVLSIIKEVWSVTDQNRARSCYARDLLLMRARTTR